MIEKRPPKPRDRRRSAAPTVADVMTQVVVTVTPDTPVEEAVELFARRHISGAPVVSKEGDLLGVVSTTDVLRSAAGESAYYLEDELSGTLAPSTRPKDARTVAEIATRKVVSIDEDAPLAKAAQVLLELGIRRLLVTRRGRLAGLLSSTDIVKWVARPALESRPM